MKKIILAILITPICFAASHHPQDFLTKIRGTKNEGQKIVEHYCATCHAEQPLINLGAPRIKNHTDWFFRKKQGLKNLFNNTNQGKNYMPARGGCFECTDEHLLLAIEALLP